MNPDTPGGAPLERSPEGRPPMGQNYRFTQEELRVLRQCNKDSFYQRCLPVATALGGATYFAVKNGYLRPHGRFGAAPKVSAAVVIGYFIGKFSYQSKCAEMLMKLPDSKIGEMLRQKRRQGGSGSYSDTISLDPGFGPGFSIPGFGEAEVYSDIAPTHDLDSDRPYQKGLDEFYRPSLDTPLPGEDSLPPATQPRAQTYEELRRKNREEFEQRKAKPYRSGSTSEDVPTTLQPRQPPLAEPSFSPERPSERNKYGDLWEK